jgi:hypothetical protein
VTCGYACQCQPSRGTALVDFTPGRGGGGDGAADPASALDSSAPGRGRASPPCRSSPWAVRDAGCPTPRTEAITGWRRGVTAGGGVLAGAGLLFPGVDPLADLLGGVAQGGELGGVENVEEEVAYLGHVSWGGFGEMGVAGVGQDRLGVRPSSKLGDPSTGASPRLCMLSGMTEPGSEHVKVHFRLEIENDWPPAGVESLWAIDRGNGEVELANTPFFVPGCRHRRHR